MRLVSFIVLVFACVPLGAAGQTCFTVEGPGGKPLAQAEVRCSALVDARRTDPHGQVCVPLICDSVHITAAGFAPRIISLAEARILGRVQLVHAANTLDEVVVEHWPRTRDRQVLAATATLDSALLMGFERSSLRSAAVWVPGVQWDERGHGGSPRLSIRGSIQRSVYGTRGVKAYWGPFPITLADGSSPIELLDPLLVGSLAIVRSVGSPTYGTAPSGLLLAGSPLREVPGNDVAVEATAGSFGYHRIGTVGRMNSSGKQLTAGFVHQRNSGYRRQESSARDQAFLSAAFIRGRNATHVSATWQKASWELPGSVDERTALNDPRAARTYSELLDAHVDKEQVLVGVSNELRLGGIHFRTGIHGQLIDKTNPYGTSPLNCGFKEETARAVGARVAVGADRLFKLPVAWDIGLEALRERDHLRELYYVDGIKGDIKVNGDTRVANLNLFAVTVTRLSRTTTLHAGAGMERTGYDHTDEKRRTRTTRTTTPAVLPYAGVEQIIGHGFRLGLRYAESLSRATVWEMLGADGTLSTDLRGERVREWEFGADNAGADGPIRADVRVYHRKVKDMITQRPAFNDGPTTYVNADQALVMGMELLVGGALYANGLKRVELVGSCTISASDLHEDGHSVGDLPGVPLVSAALLCRTHGIGLKGLGLEAGARLIGSMATGGLEATDDTHVEHLRISWRLPVHAVDISILVHVENLLDARYSGWISVNDPGGRYYNPAPSRSVYGGVRFGLGSAPKG